MPRHPKLRKKKIGKTVYWFTKAGGDTYFGNVKEVPFKDAKKLYTQHLESVPDAQQDRKSRELTAGDLMGLSLDKGLLVFKNTLKVVLKVPTPSGSGERRIAPGKEFAGDDSLMRFVRFGMASRVSDVHRILGFALGGEAGRSVAPAGTQVGVDERA